MFTSSLVAWTTMQLRSRPEQNPLPSRPAPEPQPSVQVPENPPDSSTAPVTPDSQQPNEEAQSAARTFTGIVGKQGDTYVLSVDGSESYKLDDQDGPSSSTDRKSKFSEYSTRAARSFTPRPSLRCRSNQPK